MRTWAHKSNSPLNLKTNQLSRLGPLSTRVFRSAAMLRHKASCRSKSAQMPFGRTVDPSYAERMVRDVQEQAIIRHIIVLHNEGMGYREIGRLLEAEGLDCRGGQWYHTTIKQIL